MVMVAERWVPQGFRVSKIGQTFAPVFWNLRHDETHDIPWKRSQSSGLPLSSARLGFQAWQGSGSCGEFCGPQRARSEPAGGFHSPKKLSVKSDTTQGPREPNQESHRYPDAA